MINKWAIIIIATVCLAAGIVVGTNIYEERISELEGKREEARGKIQEMRDKLEEAKSFADDREWNSLQRYLKTGKIEDFLKNSDDEDQKSKIEDSLDDLDDMESDLDD